MYYPRQRPVTAISAKTSTPLQSRLQCFHTEVQKLSMLSPVKGKTTMEDKYETLIIQA